MRLVTTNLDRIFEWVIRYNKQPTNTYVAPALPIPKNSRWDGLVYLHGLLPENDDTSALNQLVLTSGDFGLAYLTERWAARFVGELFRNYTVCFIGYSIDDPILRYIMDALAADRMLGEVTPQAYAFGDYAPGQEDDKTVEWEAKGVKPILYQVPAKTRDHSMLHRTLKSWAETYRDGILGKERIVVDYAIARPSASTRQDDFVGRMLWALSDRSGLPAKRFADFDPVPSLDWLEAFSAERYRHGDLSHFQIVPDTRVNDKLRFSLVRRPTPYKDAPKMTLVSGGIVESRWDKVMEQLGRWLVRHLDDPALILWLAQQGGHLHDRLAWLIEQKLNEFLSLEREGKLDELARIRSQAPSAIPRRILRPFWHLLLTGRVKSPWGEPDLYRWMGRLNREGLTPTLRFELRELLAPKVVLEAPIPWPGTATKAETSERLDELIDWELVLAADSVETSLRNLAKAENWQGALPALLDDFQQLLRDALDLKLELGEGDDHSDRSYSDLPSISPYGQDQEFHDWVALIELLRDAWLATREIDSDRASQVAKAWFAMPYPTFKRLALFAASQDDSILPDEWVNWLVSDGAWWLWSDDTRRETLSLLVLQGRHLTPKAQERLEAGILNGPPRAMCRDDLKPERWKTQVNHSVWLCLAKLLSSGVGLGPTAAKRLTSLSAAHPDWRLAQDESDELVQWMSGTGDPNLGARRANNRAPRKRTELAKWLRQSRSSPESFDEDTWMETCRTRFYHCALALCDLARDGVWPSARWSEALYAWSEEGLVPRSWRFIAPLVHTISDEVLAEIAHSITWWLKAVSQSVDRHEGIFLDLCRRILALPHKDGVDTDEPLTRAVNHPVGHVTQALLNVWLEQKPNDNERLPADLQPFFTQLCDKSVPQFRHGRVLLASRLIPLFRVDRPWSETHLLPLFDWTKDATEARAAWTGFLWSPRLYKPLLTAMKAQFLDTVHHYAELGKHAQQFAVFLTYAALDPVDSYTSQDFRAAFGALTQEGLQKAAQALVHALEGAGKQREEYWTNRVLPLWQNVWPKSLQLASKKITESLARLSVDASGKFPAALATVQGWLQPIEHPDLVVHLLHESGLPGRFPEDALILLNAIMDDQPWSVRELEQCLAAIAQSAAPLQQDPRYQRLAEYARLHGLGS